MNLLHLLHLVKPYALGALVGAAGAFLFYTVGAAFLDWRARRRARRLAPAGAVVPTPSAPGLDRRRSRPGLPRV